MAKRYKTYFYDDDDEDSDVLIIPTSLVKDLGWSHLGELEVTIETGQAIRTFHNKTSNTMSTMYSLA